MTIKTHIGGIHQRYIPTKFEDSLGNGFGDVNIVGTDMRVSNAHSYHGLFPDLKIATAHSYH